ADRALPSARARAGEIWGHRLPGNRWRRYEPGSRSSSFVTVVGPANARIVGLGRHLPDTVVSNEDLTRLMETTDEWIQQRTGIRERRYTEGETGSADLGAAAAREALDRAGLRAEQIDLVLFATLSPDYDFPASASVLSKRLGLTGPPSLDVRNQCSGFVYRLAVADAFIKTGGGRPGSPRGGGEPWTGGRLHARRGGSRAM